MLQAEQDGTVAGNLEEKATQGYLCGRPTEVCRLRRWRKRIRLHVRCGNIAEMTIWTTPLCMPVHPILKHIIGLARIAVILDSWYDCFEYYFAILGSNSFPQPQLPQPQPSPPFPIQKNWGVLPESYLVPVHRFRRGRQMRAKSDQTTCLWTPASDCTS